jgi:hypothetical protein
MVWNGNLGVKSMGINRAWDEERGAAKTSALGILGLKLSYDMSLRVSRF